MQLILFAPPLNMIGRNLYKEMQRITDQIQLYAFDDIASLVAHLRKPMPDDAFCILIPADNHDLRRLNTIRHLMRDMRLILILPNRQAETISDGHTLRPRFVSYVDCPLADVTAVLRKMLASSRNLEQAACGRCITN